MPASKRFERPDRGKADRRSLTGWAGRSILPTMRRLLVGIVAAATVFTAGAVAAQRSAPASAAASDPYTWKNVQIAGGGFVPSIIFNQTQPDLVYARTDIGGAYRLDTASGRWVPLLDWVG